MTMSRRRYDHEAARTSSYPTINSEKAIRHAFFQDYRTIRRQHYMSCSCTRNKRYVFTSV